MERSAPSSAHDAHDASIGVTIAERFELLALTAVGGMGRVYRAHDRSSNRTVAVKLASSDGDARRFSREADLLADLDHPGIVRYIAHGLAPDGSQYLAMEWLTGEDLASRLDEGSPPIDEAIAMAAAVADALAAAHRRGVVHRDVKPANVFLVAGEMRSVKLLDFGIARGATDPTLTVTGTFVGTPAYMAPESVCGTAVDARADVYSVGALLFRCLVGHAPFQGAHELAVLAKVVLEPATPLRELRPDASPALERLVARLLQKDPSLRPADGTALATELRALHANTNAETGHVRSAISVREQRVASVVLCATRAFGDRTVTERASLATEERVRSIVEARGGAVAALANGGWVISIPHAASPTEQATRAARCALALASTLPGAPLLVATGRMLLAGERRVGEVLDRAVEALVHAHAGGPSEGVSIDPATAELLDERFRVEGDGAWRALLGEDDTVAPTRILLGKPTPCVGREPQLAMLSAMATACADESHACSALVTAPPGFGKTHVVRELLRTTIAARGDVDVMVAQCDPMRAASPLGVLSELLRRAAGVRPSDPPEVRREKLFALVARDFELGERPRMRELLGEIMGVPAALTDASPSLRAARADLSIMADSLQSAWTAWLSARTSRGMVLLLVEDLQWADAASLRLIGAAVTALDERRLFFLATSRPDGAAQVPERVRARGFVELTLAPLSAAASERLVRGALGVDVDEATVKSLARRAAGHPFHLEELVRAVARGAGATALPDSVLAMVQSRLDELDPRARQLLRAASVFGETFWLGGLVSLMGDDVTPREVRGVVLELVDRDLVIEERAARWQGETEYRFRHGLFHDGAYASLADADKLRAHRRAAEWLERVGESDPAVLAEHYDRGGVAEKAVVHFHAAATQALQRNDLSRAMEHAARARAHGPEPSIEAGLRAIEAEILFWRGSLALAAERAEAALDSLPRGSPAWFDAVSVGVGALGQLGRNSEVAAWLENAATVPSDPRSRGPHIAAICRGVTQLFWAHHRADLVGVRACLDALVDRPEPLDSYHAGWVHRVRGESAWLHARDVGLCLEELDASSAAFEQAHATRALCLTRLNAATLHGWSGASGRGAELLAQSREQAERLGLAFLQRYGQAVEGMLAAYVGASDAERQLQAARDAVGGSPRLAFLCHVVVGCLALDRGDVEAAHTAATAARDLPVIHASNPSDQNGHNGAGPLLQNDASVADQAKRTAQALFDQTRDQLGAQLSSGKDQVTDRASTVAGALREAGGKLADGGSALPDYANQAADQVERIGSYVKSRSVGQLIGDVESFARKEPLIFLGGSFALGLFAARFIKSSSHRQAKA